jgi:hypothetical protein
MLTHDMPLSCFIWRSRSFTVAIQPEEQTVGPNENVKESVVVKESEVMMRQRRSDCLKEARKSLTEDRVNESQ